MSPRSDAERPLLVRALLGVAAFVVACGGGGSATPNPASSSRADTASAFLLVDAERISDNDLTLSPIALVAGRTFVPPDVGQGADSVAAAFAQRHFATGVAFNLLRAGRAVASATVARTGDIGCIGVTGIALSRANAGGRLAVPSRAGRSFAVTSRVLRAEDRAALATQFAGLYGDSVQPAQRGAPDRIEGAALDLPDGSTLLFGVLTSRTPYGSFDSTVSAVGAVRRMGQTTQPVLGVVRRGADDNQGSESYLDALDVDHDGWPEFVTRLTYSESYVYAVYGRRDGTWHQLYLGGGGGC